MLESIQKAQKSKAYKMRTESIEKAQQKAYEKRSNIKKKKAYEKRMLKSEQKAQKSKAYKMRTESIEKAQQKAYEKRSNIKMKKAYEKRMIKRVLGISRQRQRRHNSRHRPCSRPETESARRPGGSTDTKLVLCVQKAQISKAYKMRRKSI